MTAQQLVLLHNKKWPAFFLLVFLPVLVFCRQPATSLPFTTLGIEHGLSNNTVRSIFQDHNGFMWFGTVDGLNRYDGSGFKVYRNKINDTNSLVNNIVYAITEDSAHHLWLGTRQGISRLDPILGRFTTVLLKSSGQVLNTVVKEVRADRNNNLFFGSEGMGLLVCNKNSIQAEPVPLIGKNKSITQYTAKNIRVDKDNNVWVLVHKIGLALYDRKAKKLVLVNDALPNGAWMETEGQSLWIPQGTTLYNYNTVTRLLMPVLQDGPDMDSNGVLLHFSIDASHRFWIVRSNGKMISWKPGEANALVQGPGKNNYAFYGGLYSIFIDRQSRMWVGTGRGGLHIVDPLKGRFRTIAHEPGNGNSLVDNIVYSMYEAPDGKLYIGTEGNGVQIWDRATNRFTSLPYDPGNPASLAGLSDIIIPRILADHQGQIWIATFRKGINRYDPNTKKIERYTLFNTLSNNQNNVVFALLEDRQHRLWASALRQNSIYGGLYLYNRAANRFELFDAALSDLFSLFEDKQGNLWGGNLSQLVKIDRETKAHKFYPIGHAVRAITEDHHGNLWIGAEGGGLQLFDRTNGAITARYTTSEGLCNDMVLNILPDSLNNVWISTFNGLSKFDIAKREFKNYYQADGLQSNQFHFNSALALRSGELAFGGIKGISLFRPADIGSNHYMPRLLLTDLVINNVPIEKDNRYIRQAEDGHIESLTIPYDKAVFSFRYTALEYTAAEKISYAYYMDGWDRNWTQTGNIKTAAYTHLNEGNYIFRVRSTNAEGEWNPQEIAIRITVLPPWYRSWWAYTLYAIALVGAIYLFYLYKIRQNRLHYEVKVAQLQAKEAQLTIQQEKEIHEKRLAFFTHVSHEFRTPLTLIIDPVREMLGGLAGQSLEPQQNELNMVYRNARRLLSLVDQLLLFRKAESESDNLCVTELDLNELGRDVYDCFVHQARIKRIDYQFKCTDDKILLYADREKLEIMLFNLLSNAIKFTPPEGQVVLQIATTAENVTVQVTDSGPGIPPEVGDKLFNRFYQVKSGQAPVKTGFGIGLYLVKHFTLLHHGQVTYESKPGTGTSFCITLQTGHAHFAATDIYKSQSAQSAFLEELTPVVENMPPDQNKELDKLVTEKPTILVVDDDDDLRKYVSQVFSANFQIMEAVNGRVGLQLVQQYLPDLIISDVTMAELGGMELCRQVKDNPSLTHIPVILLTASTAQDSKLKGLESGADDYITKPFDKELLKARVMNLLKKRNSLQQYFYNEITLQQNDQKVSVEYREFLEKCIGIVEKHLDDETFSIKTLTMELGMSRSTLYRKVNSVSGQSIVGFIRFIRLRKAAELMVNTEYNVTEIASMTGFNDIKYFRLHFNQLFGMNPSEYIKKFRKPLHNDLRINRNIIKPE